MDALPFRTCTFSPLFIYICGKLYSVTLNTESEINNNRILLTSQGYVPQGDHMISILLLLPFLISVPFFSVGIYSTLATQLVAFTAGCSYWIFNFFTKTKCYQNPQLAGAFPRLCVGAGLPVCVNLWTVGTSLCLKAYLDAVPHKRKTGTRVEGGKTSLSLYLQV